MGKETEYETLSAMLDGEADELALRRLLRDLDDESAATWTRWHLARDIMHGHESVAVPEGFAEGVVGQLDSPGRPARPGWLAGAARMVVAASVAAATVVGWQFWNAGQLEGAGDRMASSTKQEIRMSGPVGEAALVAQGGSTRQAGADRQPRQERQQRLNSLVIRHNDLTARHGQQGVMPYARLVSMEGQDER